MIMLKKQIYKGYFMSTDMKEKEHINKTIRDELYSKYKVLRITSLIPRTPTEEELNNYDFIYCEHNTYSCTYSNYEIFKKPKELTDDEIVLILGNLMFGYSKDAENLYSIYND